MKIFSQKTFVYFLMILASFGFFYAIRENILDRHLEKANHLCNEGQNNEALVDFLFADALVEQDGDVFLKMKRAEIFYVAGDLRAAEKELLKVLKEDKNNSEVYKFLGRIKHGEGDYLEAEKYYASSYEINPTSEVLILRVKNFARAGQFSQARKVLIAKGGGVFEEDVMFYLGLLDFNENYIFSEELFGIRNGEYHKEVEMIVGFFDDFEVGGTGNSDYDLLRKAEFFNLIGETDFALSNVDVVLAKNKKYRDAYLVSGKSFLIDGEYEKSVDAFEKCLSLDVNNVEAYFYLAEIYDKTGDRELADKYEKRYESLNG
ncbi:MAG: tetratricopeptide repeat protein [Candidatus Paceibacterota bacterium]